MARRRVVEISAAALIALMTAFTVFWQVDRSNGSRIVIEGDPATIEIAVWVDGAVLHPGVYRLEDGARINDAIAAAGGLGDDADLSTFNLAARVADEQHLTI